jgi:hypothetical protein
VAVGDGYAVAVGDGYVVGVGVAVGDGYVVGVGVAVAVDVGVDVGVGVGVGDAVDTGAGLEDGGDERWPGEGERDGSFEPGDGESDPAEMAGVADDADRVSRDRGGSEVVTGTAAGLGGSPLAAASG